MPESQPPSSLTPDQPWPGAEAYTEQDHAFFHGRKRETEELRRLLQRETVTLLSGATGAGKTSLVRAGLLPGLSGDWLPVVLTIDWKAGSDQQPVSRQVLDALDTAARSRGLDAPKAERGDETLWEVFHRAGARWWSSRQRMITPLVVLDGFEEAFTAGMANATVRRHRDRFLEELSQLAANRPPSRLATQLEEGQVRDDAFDFGAVPVRILIVLQEEFAPRLSGLRALFPTLRSNELRLENFTREQAREALVRGGAPGAIFADGAVDELVSRLISGEDPEHPVPPGRLSAAGQELAGERLRRKVERITAEFIAPKPAVEAASSQAAQSPAAAESTPGTSSASAQGTRGGASGWIAAALLVIAGVGFYLWQTRSAPEEVAGTATAESLPEAFRSPASTTPVSERPATETPGLEPQGAQSPVVTGSIPEMGGTPSTPSTTQPSDTSAGNTPLPTAPPSPAPSPPASPAPAATAPVVPANPATPAAPTPTGKEMEDAAAARSSLERSRQLDQERQRTGPAAPRRQPMGEATPDSPRSSTPPTAAPASPP